MGKTEDIVIDYLSNAETFAALFNGYLFDGEQIIRPENLRETDGKLRLFLKQDEADKGKNSYEVIKRERDIAREVVIDNTTIRLAILGIEHQSEVDYSMVLRTLIYDTLEYLKQVRKINQKHRDNKDLKGKEFLSQFAQEDRIVPTFTLVFYTGREKWNAAMELKELFASSTYLENVSPFIGNWKLNLISVYDVKDTEKYHGSLRKIFDLLKYVDDGDGMLSFVEQHGAEYSELDEAAMRLIYALVDIDFYVDEQEGKVSDMCKALDDIIKIGEARGEAIGEAKKETSIILNMFRKGISCEEISSMTDIPLDKVKEVVSVQ